VHRYMCVYILHVCMYVHTSMCVYGSVFVHVRVSAS
jgi:hypothetical protein